ncbi:hypothetical protein HC891_20585 [Candidatus Gracilibacteria bacterium]|nr:hypothetical protein [Candidatus Gracilibacteria bacterium]
MARYRSSRPPARRSRSGGGCGAALILVMALLALSIIGAWWYVREQVGALVSLPPAPNVQQTVEGQAVEAVPTLVAALPSGEFAVSEADMNAAIAARAAELGVFDEVRVRFLPDQLQLDLSALGQRSTLSAGLVAENGRIVVRDARLDGPLAALIAADDLTASLEQQINSALNNQGRAVNEIRIEEGRVVVRVEGKCRGQ